MPIYAYRCESCGHSKDVLQKISDPALQNCPACGAPSFKKQVTAAGFQLKGSGWYVTDFRGGNTNTSPQAGGNTPPSNSESSAASTGSEASSPSGTSGASANSGNSGGSGSDGSGGAGGCGGACSCH